jgi:undecaprenyl-diphosphatase
MNPYLLAVLLGIVEGLTEFLPVSSTAHLRICESLLKIDLADPYWKMFTIVIQLGAILCLPFYFRERIAKFLSTFPYGERGDRTAANHPLTLVMVAFVCTAGPAYLLTKVIGKNLESLYVMAGALIIGGIVMWVIDALYARGALKRTTDHIEEVGVGQAVWIGCCQILSAVFPGTSRSMSTIAAGQLVGMSRSSALEFSFFVSIPTMAAATVYDLLKSMRPHHGEPAVLGQITFTAQSWILLGIGFVVSFIVAYGVVAWFMNWVRNRGFAPFAIYRIIVGAAVLAWAIKGR